MLSLAAAWLLAGCVDAPGGLFVPVEAADVEELSPQPPPPGAPGSAPEAAVEGGAEAAATAASEAGPMGALPVAPAPPSMDAAGAPGAAAAEPESSGGAAGVAPAEAPPEAPEPPPPEAPPPAPELCPPIEQPLLLDFEEPRNGPTQAVFGDFASSLSGGTYQYPAPSTRAIVADAGVAGLVSDVTEGDWHLSGLVAQVSGFGLFLDCQLLDAARFAGVAFTLEGSVAPERELLFVVGTASNTVAREWLVSIGNTGAPPSFGRCFPAASEFDGTCEAPRVSIPLAPERREVLVRFEDLLGGSPSAGVDPAEITSVAWALPAPLAGEEPYPVDLRVDDIRFVELAELEALDGE